MLTSDNGPARVTQGEGSVTEENICHCHVSPRQPIRGRDEESLTNERPGCVTLTNERPGGVTLTHEQSRGGDQRSANGP